MRAALIRDGVVANVVVVNDMAFADFLCKSQGYDQAAQSDTASPGDLFDGKSFAQAPPPPPPPPTQLETLVSALVDNQTIDQATADTILPTQ